MKMAYECMLSRRSDQKESVNRRSIDARRENLNVK
jgi:hypothetical protein